MTDAAGVLPAGAGIARIVIGGATLRLLPERAAFWEERQTLLIADAHWGKAAAFRAAGVAVPHGTTLDGLTRLDRLLEQTCAARVIFLGDYLHAREGRAPGTLGALAAWRARHPRLQLVLVRGNHDRHAGDPPCETGVVCVDAPMLEASFVLAHHPAASDRGFVLAGHLHPGVRLAGQGRQRERLPCFWFSRSVGVLPAFGSFTGLADVEPAAGDRVFAIAGNEVIEVPS